MIEIKCPFSIKDNQSEKAKYLEINKRKRS